MVHGCDSCEHGTLCTFPTTCGEVLTPLFACAHVPFNNFIQLEVLTTAGAVFRQPRFFLNGCVSATMAWGANFGFAWASLSSWGRHPLHRVYVTGGSVTCRPRAGANAAPACSVNTYCAACATAAPDCCPQCPGPGALIP
jgi:hypothetical protein